MGSSEVRRQCPSEVESKSVFLSALLPWRRRSGGGKMVLLYTLRPLADFQLAPRMLCDHQAGTSSIEGEKGRMDDGALQAVP